MSTRRSLRESSSWFDLLDWKFEKYLTPWIVRLNWVIAVVLASLWISFVIFTTAVSMMPTDEEVGMRSRQPDIRYEFRGPEFDSPAIKNMAWLRNRIYRLLAGLTAVIVALQTLLAIRVMLEFAIVVFDIAKSLTAINEKTPLPAR